MASICQVGIADFRDGKLYDCFVSLVDPEDYFDDMNIVIHGIDEADVVGAPIFPELYRRLSNMIAGRIVVSHTSFDRTALRQAAIRYNLPEIECHWLDSARVVRRTWRECADSGYGLRPVAEMLGINFSHHNALEDARASGEILLRAIIVSGISVEEWLKKSHCRLGRETGKPEINQHGPFAGECIVFTGAMQLTRRDVEEMAANLGFQIGDSVTKKATVLVVGDQDIKRLRPGEKKSSKHLKAESMIAKGFHIRILGESDFMALCTIEGAPEDAPK